MANGKVFLDIYENNRWEDGGSGIGSAVTYSRKYIDYVKPLIQGKKVLDLGCGDFRIGTELYNVAAEYVAVDVVSGLFTVPEGVKFVTADFSVQGVIGQVFLAHGPFDVVLLKDVLMHWSDEEIVPFATELANLSWKTLLVANKYKYVRKPEYNGRPRNPRANKYSMSPLPCDHETLSALGLTPVLYYPSKSCVQLARADKA
jgi:SAM-dependent methyltransferase